MDKFLLGIHSVSQRATNKIDEAKETAIVVKDT